MVSWEYEKVTAVQVNEKDPFEPGGEMPAVDAALFDLGSKGWELVDVRPTGSLSGPHPVVDLYLKRPR